MQDQIDSQQAVRKLNGLAITKALLNEAMEKWKITMREFYNEYNEFRAEVNVAREKIIRTKD